MYASILEVGCGFYEGVCPPSSMIAHLCDPPSTPRFANLISGDVPSKRLRGYCTVTLSAGPSRPSRDATTPRRGRVASSPLPLPRDRLSTPPGPSPLVVC